MKAKEMAALSARSFQKKKEMVWPNVIAAITVDAEAGRYNCSVDLPRYADVEGVAGELRGLGYKVKVENRELQISWEEHD